jgi:WD40 repeat protein
VFTFNGSTFAPYAPLAGLSFIDITGFDTLDGTDWVIDDGSLYEIVAGVANNVAANMATPDGVMATGPSTAFVGDSQNIIKYSQGSRTVAADDFVHVSGIEAEPNGSLLITDSDNQQVLDFDLSTKTRSAIVDGSTLPFGSITQVARLDANHLAVLTSNPGGIYSYDLTTGATIRLAGNGYHDPSIAGPADRTSLYFPSGLAVDALGDCFWAESNAIYQYTAQTGRLSVLTGTPFQPGYRDNTDLADATFNAPGGMAVDAAGNLIVADTGNNAVRLINPHSDWVTTIAALNAPMGVGPYGDGVYVSSYLANDIQFCFYNTGDGVGCSVAAGVPDFQHVQGQGKFQDGPRLEARFNSPNGLNPIAGQADLVVADQFNQRVRRVNSNASTIVGDGQEGYGPNQLNLPTSALVLDGRVYIADTGNGLLRVIALP